MHTNGLELNCDSSSCVGEKENLVKSFPEGLHLRECVHVHIGDVATFVKEGVHMHLGMRLGGYRRVIPKVYVVLDHAQYSLVPLSFNVTMHMEFNLRVHQ